MRAFRNVFYIDEQHLEQKLDLFMPDDSFDTVFIYFHGGGLVNGNKERKESFINDLINNGVALVSVDYRMYPTAKYPDFIDDAAASVGWVCNNIGKYSDCKNIFVGGSSAGGYLSMMLCFANEFYEKSGVDKRKITGYIHDAGQPTSHFNVLKEKGIDRRRVIVDETAPVYHIEADKNYPDMLFIVSDNDMKNRYEQTILTLSTLEHMGYKEKCTLKIMNGTHCAYCGKEDEAGNSVFAAIINEYIDKIIKG